MSGARKKIAVGEWLRLLEENTKAAIFLISLVASGCGVVVALAAGWFDNRMEKKIGPLRDVLMWSLQEDGKLDKYLRYKADKDSAQHALESRTTSAGFPIWRAN